MHIATYLTRDFYTELGGFNIDFKVAGDFEMFARAFSKAPFERVPARIACFRRTGLNFSVVNPELAARDARLILEAFGPASSLERQFWQRTLQAWINLRNPHWYIVRRLGSLRWRLGLQEKKYF
jgi:hypothetical protein